MERRTALKGLAGAVGIAGGVAGIATLRGPPEPGPVTNIEFSNDQPTHPGEEPHTGMGPLIEQIDERTIQIRGVLAVGDTDNEAGIEDVRYDSDADTLTFIVSNHWAGTIGLGDALGIDGYEARITFESIPERLIATEIDWQGDEYTTIFEL